MLQRFKFARVVGSRVLIFSVLFLSFLLCLSTPGYAQSPLYQGKSIRLIVGSSAGGAQDLWARFIA
jgi:tripartite-type tricarboxylate transporter receptor subunit TctC